MLLIDEHERMLLFHDSDRLAGASWWMTPGGGIEPGEDELTAVLREVREETGLVLDASVVRGPIAHRHVVHGYSDVIVEQDDSFYVARVPAFEISTAGHTADEQNTLLGHRWWTRADLLTTSDTVWPELLPELWDLAGRRQDWPWRLPDVQESTVPV